MEPFLLREGVRMPEAHASNRPVVIAVVVTALIVGSGMYLWHLSVISALTASNGKISATAQISESAKRSMNGQADSSTGGATAEAASSPNEQGVAALENLNYYTTLSGGTVRVPLVSGEYYFPLPVGEPADRYEVALDQNFIATGDLNADGAPDAAVLLRETRGGPNVFYGVGIVMNWNGSYQAVATGYLGDRIAVKDVRIKNGVVEVDLLWHRPNDLLCCPTNPRTDRFKLTDRGLEQF